MRVGECTDVGQFQLSSLGRIDEHLRSSCRRSQLPNFSQAKSHVIAVRQPYGRFRGPRSLSLETLIGRPGLRHLLSGAVHISPSWLAPGELSSSRITPWYESLRLRGTLARASNQPIAFGYGAKRVGQFLL